MRRPLPTALAVALGVHLLLAAICWKIRRLDTPAASPPADLSVEVEVDEPLDPRPHPGVAKAHDGAPPQGLQARLPPVAARDAMRPGESASASASDAREVSASPLDAPSTGEAHSADPIAFGPVDIGLARPGERPSPLMLPPTSNAGGAQRAMVDALDANDTALGTGPGGVVARVTRDVIHASLAPDRGEATFEATTDPRGIATEVRLLDADADPRAWEDLARVVLRELKKSPVRVHAGARGTRVVFRVRSLVRLPSGSPERGNPVVLQGLGVGGAFDVTDVGAHPLRVVDVFVVSETRI